MSLLILDPEQKQFFDDNGYLLLKGFYGPAEMEQMHGEFHRLVTEIENRPKNVKYSFMDAPEGYAPDPFNPRNVVGLNKTAATIDQWGNACAFAGLPLARNGQLLMPRVYQG